MTHEHREALADNEEVILFIPASVETRDRIDIFVTGRYFVILCFGKNLRTVRVD